MNTYLILVVGENGSYTKMVDDEALLKVINGEEIIYEIIRFTTLQTVVLSSEDRGVLWQDIKQIRSDI
jgi:hypothetical protein